MYLLMYDCYTLLYNIITIPPPWLPPLIVTLSSPLSFSYLLHTAPIDYSTIFSTISFASGETQRDITIQTIEDSIQEGSENFTVYLFQVASSVLIYDIATVEISADEIITIGFEATNYTVNEGDAVNLTVVLSGQNITVETTVMVSTVDGTATGMS